MRNMPLYAFCFVLATLGFSSPTPTTSHWLGEIKVSSPLGREPGTSLSLVKRTLDPKANLIVEDILHVNQREASKPYLMIYQMDKSLKSFSVRAADGAISGTGSFSGNLWHWDQWKVDATLKDGTHFRSQHHNAKGRTLVKKEFLDPQGKVRLIYSEELKEISPELYDLLHSKLSRTQNKTPLG